PACEEHRNAHAAPNSSGLPKRLAGMPAMRLAATSATLLFCCSAVLLNVLRKRSVSKAPGRILLMVTLRSATLRATPARKAVRPARAPEDKSRPASGIFTEPEVMLTILPKLR